MPVQGVQCLLAAVVLPSAEILRLVAQELTASGHAKEADKALRAATKLERQVSSQIASTERFTIRDG